MRGTGIAGVLALSAMAVAAQAGILSPELERAMARRGSESDVAVIVRFTDPVDDPSLVVVDRRSRDNRLFVSLVARSTRHLTSVKPFLASHEARSIKELWIINGFAATLPASAVRKLVDQPGIERIGLDSLVQGGRSQRMPPSRGRQGSSPPLMSPAAPVGMPSYDNIQLVTAGGRPSWNVAAVHGPQLWALGHLGQGVVVASMDTGVDLAHPELRGKWRGGTNSWFDPHGEEAEPHDALGHGTQSMGVMIGNPSIGLAPAARWIAVRLFNGDGRASMSDIHRAFQWLMDPDGDPTTIDAPDIVNASWALTSAGMGACHLEFSDDVMALRHAGIAVVFAAGNDGPSTGSSNSPGNNPGVVSVGAVDRDLEVARQTSRGPSSCDQAIFPRLVAPGVDVRTADLSHGGQPSFTTKSGSSMAAPHVAGVLALLAGAFPSASVAELEESIVRSARDLGAPGADNSYGHGLIDAMAAYQLLGEARAPAVARAALMPSDSHETSNGAHSPDAHTETHSRVARRQAPDESMTYPKALP